jgi:hypothetical protein
MTDSLLPLARQTFAAAEMVASYPPRLVHAHKKLIYRLAYPPERPHAGTLTVTRWAAPLPADPAGIDEMEALCRAVAGTRPPPTRHGRAPRGRGAGA